MRTKEEIRQKLEQFSAFCLEQFGVGVSHGEYEIYLRRRIQEKKDEAMKSTLDSLDCKELQVAISIVEEMKQRASLQQHLVQGAHGRSANRQTGGNLGKSVKSKRKSGSTRQ